MTQPSIQAQVDSIKKTTEKLLQSKEAALKFLKDAGIIKPETAKKEDKKKN